jgi:hypothetical protein
VRLGEALRRSMPIFKLCINIHWVPRFMPFGNFARVL